MSQSQIEYYVRKFEEKGYRVTRWKPRKFGKRKSS